MDGTKALRAFAGDGRLVHLRASESIKVSLCIVELDRSELVRLTKAISISLASSVTINAWIEAPG